MATSSLISIPASKKADTVADAISKVGKLSVDSQKKVVEFVNKCLEKKKQFTQLIDKMDAIDVAYARYTTRKAASAGVDGIDVRPEDSTACNVFASDDVTPPIVVSQVDTYVGYLSEIFLSGTPMFPVVSRPGQRQWAEQLETLLDDHSIIGAYPRQLLLFIRDGVKYNLSAIEVKWDSINQFSVTEDVLSTGQSLNKTSKKFNRLKRLNPRNVVWDYSLNPGDVSENGDYAGYIERFTRIKFKRLLNKWMTEGKSYNMDKAWGSVSNQSAAGYTPNYVEDPQISSYVPNKQALASGVDWDAYFDPRQGQKGVRPPTGVLYELTKIYARIMPSDFGMSAPQPNTPQIWEFIVCNGQWLVYASRVISAYDYLPILFGQPLEDGLGYQTQSVAESEIEFQDAAKTLFNIRFAAARRAVSDRALYLADMIKPSDINSPVAAPKIPVQISALSSKKIGDAYHQIPFDMRGTESTIQDAATIVSFSKDLHGINGPRQGSFQKGNKSVTEWNDTMGGSDSRMRLPALTLEHQVFSPMKSMMTLNIFQYGDDVQIVSQKTGEILNISIDELRKQILSFRLADGYTPKSKIASTDVLVQGLTVIQNSPILQQAYGNRLPAMFAHFMSLAGAKGFEEYDPSYMQAQEQQNQAGLPGGLQGNTVQAPAAPVVPPNPATAAQVTPNATQIPGAGQQPIA
jgi:hypothetical protein